MSKCAIIKGETDGGIQMRIEVEKEKHNRRFKEPPKFYPKRFKGDRLKWQGCWPYALNAKYGYFAVVGDFIGKRKKYNATNEELISTIIEEGEYFGLEIKQVDEEYKPKKGEYIIYLKRGIHDGYYHFFRRDENGIWSHKHPGKIPERVNFKKEHYVPEGDHFCVGFFFSVKEKDS